MIYKSAILLTLLLFLVRCGSPTNKSQNVIGTEEPIVTIQPDTIPIIIEPELPEGAVIGNYNGDLRPFYATISEVNKTSGTTKISFENNEYPKLTIPKTRGGSLSRLILDGFDRDLLLVTARIKDPNFNKYYLYVLRDNQWKPVMNGFAIHKSNLNDSLVPVQIDSINPNNIMRYYSVFNLDEKSETGYNWLLLQESVSIENR